MPASDEGPTRPPVTPGAASEVYAPLIAAELAELRAVKASFEARAVAVITTSGVLVTLLFGMAALQTGRENFALPESTRPALFIALALFVVAAVLALVVNLPRAYDAPTVDGLRAMLGPPWHSEPWIARRRVGMTLVAAIASYKRGNEQKARFLKLAIGAECVAVGFVALAVAIIIGT
jgi:hypothetical protein